MPPISIRRAALAVALVATVVVPTLGHAQPRNEDDYVFLVKRFALVKNESVVNGNVGVQNARGKLKVGRVATILGLGVGDRVFLNAGATVLEVFANTLKFNPAKTFPGPVTQPVPLPVYVSEPLVVPDPFDPVHFPTGFPIACGGPSKRGAKHEVFALPPGDYAAVTVAQGGRLVLAAGTYNFCVLEAVRGDIEVAGPVTINVRDKFGLGNQASLLPNPPLTANDVQVNFAGKSIRISAGSRFTGRIFAPEGQIRLGRQAVVIGHFVSDKLRSDKGFTAFPPADTAAMCGDGTLQGNETCDPPGVAVPPNQNTCRLGCTFCGDHLLQPGEDCDDGNTDDNDACRNDCTFPPPPLCGNGVVDAPETCDPPGSDPPPQGGNLCRTGCSYCGDGVADAGEACDDGNTVDDDDCTNMCGTGSGQQTLCGDDIVGPGETCDPPGSDPAPPGGNLCRVGCTYCGDGHLDGTEECDDGNTTDDDGCRNNCMLTPSNPCGNFQLDAGETCDPPGSDPAPAGGDLCRVNCTYCGDGGLQAGEDCDDGNTDDQDSCSNDCRINQSPMCGDGILDPGETCDPPGSDPMAPNGDMCGLDCTFCGDGVVDPDEQCDDAGDGDDPSDDGSSACDGSSDDSSSCGGTSDSESSDASSSDSASSGGSVSGESSGCDGSSGDSSSCGGTSDSNSSDDSSSDDSDSRQDLAPCDTDDGDSVECRDDCTLEPEPRCGDGAVNRICETCDPPGSEIGMTGIICSLSCSFCGDGSVDPGEECDPGEDDDSSDGGSSGCDTSSEDSSSCGGSSDSVSSDASSSGGSSAGDDSSGCDGSSGDSSSCGGTSDSESSDDSSSDDSSSETGFCNSDCTLADPSDDDSSACDGSSGDSSSCGGNSDSQSSDASSSDDSSSDASMAGGGGGDSAD